MLPKSKYLEAARLYSPHLRLLHVTVPICLCRSPALALARAHNLILVQDGAAAASGKDRVGGGMVTLHQMAEATLGQGGATASSAVYLGAQSTWVVLSA